MELSWPSSPLLRRLCAAAVAQVCPPGRYYQTGICYPIGTTGEVIGGAANAAGAIVGGTVGAAGALAGGAVNAAGQVVGGTVGAVTGQPPHPPAGPNLP